MGTLDMSHLITEEEERAPPQQGGFQRTASVTQTGSGIARLKIHIAS